MPSTRFGSLKIAAYELEAPAAVVAAGRELEHREQRQEQVAEDHDEDRDPRAELAAGTAAAAPAPLGRAMSAPPRARPRRAGRWRGHRTHREARRWMSA